MSFFDVLGWLSVCTCASSIAISECDGWPDDDLMTITSSRYGK